MKQFYDLQKLKFGIGLLGEEDQNPEPFSQLLIIHFPGMF